MKKQTDDSNQSAAKPGRGSLKLTGFIPRTALEVTRATIKGVLGHALPKPIPDRVARMIALVEQEIKHMPLFSLFPAVGEPAVRLSLDESFGKPLLVTVDLLFADLHYALSGLDAEEEHALRVLVADVLERVIRVLWDNPMVAPIAVRGRVLVVRNPEEEWEELKPTALDHLQLLPGEILIVDMQGLGFVDELARSEDLYERFGAPASDPHWRP